MSIEMEVIGQRNSPYRNKSEDLFGPPVRFVHWLIPGLKAKDVSEWGERAVKGGVRLMEMQHRAKKYSPMLIIIALGLIGGGLSSDLFDGILARLIRSEMCDPEAKLADEREGQVYDPLIDGRLEAFQSKESAETARVLGRPWGVIAAAFSLGTGNLARTAKSVAGWISRKPVPETYPLKDPRTPGTSIGRKLLYVATVMPRIPLPVLDRFPLQEVIHAGVGVANLWVTGERLSAIFTPPLGSELDPKEVDFAGARARHLGALSIRNFAEALSIVRNLTSEAA